MYELEFCSCGKPTFRITKAIMKSSSKIIFLPLQTVQRQMEIPKRTTVYPTHCTLWIIHPVMLWHYHLAQLAADASVDQFNPHFFFFCKLVYYL